MKRRLVSRLLLASATLFCATPTTAQTPIVIRAGTLIDGKGGVQRDAVIVVDGQKIQRVGAAARSPTRNWR